MSMQDKPGTGWNLTVVVFTFASIPWWAWIAAKLWFWFVVPLGLPAIGMAHALGLSSAATLFVRSFGVPNRNDGYSEKERDIGRLAQAWLVPLFVLIVGAVSRRFMQ